MPYNIKQISYRDCEGIVKTSATFGINSFIGTNLSASDPIYDFVNINNFQITNKPGSSIEASFTDNNLLKIKDKGEGSGTEIPKVPKTVIINGDDIQETRNYYDITSDILGSEQIVKLGYCCKDNYGKNFPIFLTINNNTTMFYPSKDGMYEFQPEEWKDVNDIVTEEDGSEHSKSGIAIINVSGVQIPVGFEFVLDYCF